MKPVISRKDRLLSIDELDRKQTVGENFEEDGQGNRMLAGIPILFQQSTDLGYFVTTEWQVEGPLNFMYYSSDGEVWVPVQLPAPERKIPDYDCCYAASIIRLCLVDSGAVYFSYAESPEFQSSGWLTPIDDSFPESINWSRVSKLPDYARCDGNWRRDFVPRSLREKTKDGALFDVSTDWAVLIPGATR